MATDPFNSFNFHVELDGITRAGFQQCTGFDSTIDVVEHREGGDNNTTRKFPGLNKFGNIQLKRGMTEDTELYDWHRRVVDGDIERKSGSIILLDRLGKTVARWEFERAFPVKYDGPDLDAEKSEIAIEMLELAHEGCKRTI